MNSNTPRKGARTFVSLPIRFIFAGALAICLASSGPALCPERRCVIAKIGDKPITERDLALATADLAEQFAQVPEEQPQGSHPECPDRRQAAGAKGEAAGIEKEPSFVARMQFLRDRALHNAYFQENASNKVTDEEVKARYDKEVAAMPPQQEVHAMHILVKTKEEAEKIIKELEAGKDFGELAKTSSTDPSAAQNGGDLGFFAKGQMVPEFEAAVFAMKDGEFTKTPVQTQFGFHVIKRVEERNVPAPEFKDVESQVRQIVVREKYVGIGRGRPQGRDDRGARREPEEADRPGCKAAAMMFAAHPGDCMSSKVSPLAPKSVVEVPPIEGVRLGSVEAGIKYKNRKDLTAIVFDVPATVAGVFTRSKCSSAPVDWCRKQLEKGKARCVVVNSGNSNAFTGKKGVESVKLTAEAASEAFGCKKSEVFIASTGVIGEPLNVASFAAHLKSVAGSAREDGWADTARAIMTTDTYPKLATRSFEADGADVRRSTASPRARA